MNKFIIPFLLFAALVFLFACNKGGKSSEESSENTIEPGNEENVILTKKQFEFSNMKIGDMLNFTFEEQITSNGIISVESSGKAKVNTPLSGIVANIAVIPGQYVKKGQFLFSLESKEIIDIQQEYGESMSLFKALESEYARQKNLFEQKVISEKEFLTSESNFKSMKAKCSGLFAKLKLLNINPDKVLDGIINPRIGIFAPINGFVTSLNVVQGQYTDPQSTLLEIINMDQLILKLFVFEKDIAYLKKGQKITFYKPSDHSRLFEAEISTIGKTIHPENKTIECYAKIKNDDSFGFINDTYVEAMISINQKVSKAVPNNAVVKSGDEYFIFVRKTNNGDDYTFKKIKVNIGLKNDSYTEILTDSLYKNVLIEGAYNLSE